MPTPTQQSRSTAAASAGPPTLVLGADQYLALIAALLGWLFDGAEMGVFSMVGRRAMSDLLATTDEGLIGVWFGVVTAGFLVGAATGGVLFGWLGDRIGRVRAMTLSILTYALFTGLCGFATSAWQLGALRFIAALGMGGEWSLGVALVMEIWPNRSPRVHGWANRRRGERRLSASGCGGLGAEFHIGQSGGVVNRCRHAGRLDRGTDLARRLAAADDVRHGAGAFDIFDSAVRPGVKTLGAGARPRLDQFLGHARSIGRLGRALGRR